MYLTLWLRHSLNCLENATRDFVRITSRIGTAIFQVPLVPTIDETVWHTNRCSTICETVIEFVDRLCFVQPRQTQMVIWTIDRDMFVFILVERRHQRFEIFFAASITHIGG